MSDGEHFFLRDPDKREFVLVTPSPSADCLEVRGRTTGRPSMGSIWPDAVIGWRRRFDFGNSTLGIGRDEARELIDTGWMESAVPDWLAASWGDIDFTLLPLRGVAVDPLEVDEETWSTTEADDAFAFCGSQAAGRALLFLGSGPLAVLPFSESGPRPLFAPTIRCYAYGRAVVEIAALAAATRPDAWPHLVTDVLMADGNDVTQCVVLMRCDQQRAPGPSDLPSTLIDGRAATEPITERGRTRWRPWQAGRFESADRRVRIRARPSRRGSRRSA